MPVINGKHLPYTKKNIEMAKKHHSGKGTKARLNTAAEKMMYGSKFSK